MKSSPSSAGRACTAALPGLLLADLLLAIYGQSHPAVIPWAILGGAALLMAALGMARGWRQPAGQIDADRVKCRLVRRLETLGYAVSLTPTPTAG